MESLGSIFNPIIEFLQTGFNQVNAVQGLLIALFATVLMARWAQLFAIALAAGLVHVVLDTAIPIVAKGADIKLPAVMTAPFWQYALSLYVGFVIIIAMFFAVKSVLFGVGKAKGAKAH
ncbi:MAG: hypothetical protein AB7M12_11605 [Hyphomonadaceae bacterium]